MRVTALTLCLLASTVAAKSAPKPAVGEAAAKKLLVKASPANGVEPAKTVTAIVNPVLAKRYPKLHLFGADHKTKFFEYREVKSLALIDAKGVGLAVVEMLFSEVGWQDFLDRFKGGDAHDAAGATDLVIALRDVLGPRVWPIDFKATAPEKKAAGLEVVLAERNGRKAVLAVGFDDKFVVTAVNIVNR